jgi:hypothetical protein
MLRSIIAYVVNADAIEGALNLYNREPIPTVADWLDREIQTMFNVQQPDGIVDGWHGDGNFARTAIMFALWKSQGATLRSWRADVAIGAVMVDDRLYLLVTGHWPWEGRVIFDAARHRTVMQLPIDYPRINQFPEWFVVEADGRYELEIDGNARIVPGRELQGGIPVQLTVDQRERRLSIKRLPAS